MSFFAMLHRHSDFNFLLCKDSEINVKRQNVLKKNTILDENSTFLIKSTIKCNIMKTFVVLHLSVDSMVGSKT